MVGHRMKQSLAVILSIGILFLTTGCWDLRELQDRNFIMAAAIDTADEGGKGPEVTQVETYTQSLDSKPFRLSLQALKLSAPSTQDSKASAASKTFVLSTTGKSNFEMVRDMLGQSSKALYFEHLQTIIISERALKKSNLANLLDFWIRDSEMRWRIKVFVTSGEARSLLEFVPPTGEPGGRFFQGVIFNQKKDAHVPGARTDLGFIVQSLDNGTDSVLPRVEMADKVVKVSGCALFKKGQFMGYADEYTTRGFKLLMGTEKSLVIPVACPEHPEDTVTLEVFHHDTKLAPHFEDGKLYFTLDISMEGTLGEASCRDLHSANQYEYYKMAEQLFADEVKNNALHSYGYLQSMGVDALKFGNIVRAHYPQEWKEMKETWDEDIFPTVPIYVTVDVTIRGIGEHM